MKDHSVTVRFDDSMLDLLDSMMPILGSTRSECIVNALVFAQGVLEGHPLDILKERAQNGIESHEYSPAVISLSMDKIEAEMKGLSTDQGYLDREILSVKKRLDLLTEELYRKRS